jgi:hypothetical protein
MLSGMTWPTWAESVMAIRSTLGHDQITAYLLLNASMLANLE